jgi:transcriptional regulator with XRE-family HTH domain
MNKLLKTYLRTFRRSQALTQKELAFLIGVKSGTTISRLEQLKRLPNLSVALACLVIFDAAPFELFPGLFSDVRKAVLERANQLYEELQGDASRSTRAKLDFLETLLAHEVRSSEKDV